MEDGGGNNTVRAKLHPEVQKNGRWQEVTRHAVRAKLQPEIQENVQRMAEKSKAKNAKRPKLKLQRILWVRTKDSKVRDNTQ